MTDDELREMEKRLYASDDAKVWAKEFCQIFNVGSHAVSGDVVMPTADQEGLMAGWFANAMETATYLRGLKDRG